MDEIAQKVEAFNGIDYRRKEVGETVALGDIARSVKNAYRTFFVEKSLIGTKITLETESELLIFTSEPPNELSEKTREEREARFLQKAKEIFE